MAFFFSRLWLEHRLFVVGSSPPAVKVSEDAVRRRESDVRWARTNVDHLWRSGMRRVAIRFTSLHQSFSVTTHVFPTSYTAVQLRANRFPKLHDLSLIHI